MKIIDIAGGAYQPLTTPTGKLLWVDSEKGNDSLAQRGFMTVPFATLTAAKNAASSGDTIVVMPGVYGEKDLLKNGVNWHFMTGARVIYSGGSDGAIFDTGGNAISSAITGDGEFANSATGTNSNVVLVTTSGGSLRIQGRSMSAAKCAVKVNVSSGLLAIEVALDVRSSSERAIQNLGSSDKNSINANLIHSSSGAAVYIGSGAVQIQAHRIEGTGATSEAAIEVKGGTGYSIIRAFEIASNQNPGLRWASTTAAKIGVYDARISGGGSGVNGRAVDISGSGASDNVRLHNCVLLASTTGSPSGDYSIAASTSGTRVHLVGGAAGNKGYNNVNPFIGTYFSDANVS